MKEKLGKRGDVRSVEEAEKLIQVALGRRPADLVVINSKLLNVYSGQLLENHSVCVWDRWIAYVGQEPKSSIGNDTHVIDAAGKILLPGFIDGHTHLTWLFTVEDFLKYAMKGGTTTIITEAMEEYPVAGLAGVIDYLDSLKNQPVKIFATAPCMVSISNRTKGIKAGDLRVLLERDDIIGLGESYWQEILEQPEFYLPAFTETLQAGKTLEGHSAGARERKLMAYLTTGVSSCHESINSEEVIERLQLGLHVMVREGSIRRDLTEIAKIKDRGADLRRLSLVSDGIEPCDLTSKGYMEYIVQKAIDCGFEPLRAIQMATLNVAEHFRLDHLIGGIAPGRYADMLIIPDLRNIQPEYVISNGKIIAKDGELLVSPRPHTFLPASINSIKLNKDLKPKDFLIGAPDALSRARVRVIGMVTDLVTQELIIEMDAVNGEIRANVSEDMLKVAALDRSGSNGKISVGLLKGFGMKSGAIASSAAWDTANIIVVGAEDSDMALAVNRIRKLQGGVVICNNGEILEELHLPIFGLMSDSPMHEIARKVESISSAAAQLGIAFRNPILSLVTLTTAAIPFFRICEEGLVDLKTGKTLGLFVES